MIAVDWAAAAIPLAALIIAVGGLLVGAVGRRDDRARAADQDYVRQLERRLDDEVARNDRLEEDLRDHERRLKTCEDVRRQLAEDNARLMYEKLFGKEVPDGPGPIAAPG